MGRFKMKGKTLMFTDLGTIRGLKRNKENVIC